jgi:uncharacterized membrane protein YhfC
MLHLMFALEIAIMIGFPIALWFALRRRLGVTWGLILAGAVTFVASQVVHIPLLLGLTWLLNRPGVWPFAPSSTATLLSNAVIVGLAAGVCEETARYLVLRFWRRDARAWAPGVAFGAGHGGIEAILVGMGVLISLVVNSQTLLSVSWYLPLLGGLERVFAVILQIAFALLVVQAFTRRNPGWLAAAILGHALVDGVAVFLSGMGWHPLALEGMMLPFALGSLALILALRRAASIERQPGGQQAERIA